MDNKSFLTLCTHIFESNGFIRKGKTFYYDNRCGILLVFGLQKSNYGAYYYMEHGVVFTEINKHLPNPKYNELDINLGRIMPAFGKALCYESMDEDKFSEFVDTIQQKLDVLLPIVNGGKEKIIQEFFSPTPRKISYVLNGVVEYLGIDTEYFQNHRIPIVTD